MMKSIRLYMSGRLAGPSAGGVWRGARGPTKRADSPESASATCAVTKRPRGPVVGQLVDTFTVKSVLVPDSACAAAAKSEQTDPETESNASDEPRDVVLFQPFLRPVGGEDRAWGDTVWLTQLLNEERAKAGEPPAPHKNVMRGARTAMEKLGESVRLNFEPVEYLDKHGKTLPLIGMSEIALPVISEAGHSSACATCTDTRSPQCHR